MTKTQLTHIPYKGGAPMMAELMSGQIRFAIETSPSGAPHVRGGRVRALVVTTLQRPPAYPGVPTLDESGLPGYAVTTWFALMAPHGVPPAVMRLLREALAKVLADADVAKRFDEQGVTAGTLRPDELAAFIRGETAKWIKTSKDAGITAE